MLSGNISLDNVIHNLEYDFNIAHFVSLEKTLPLCLSVNKYFISS